ncbi:MAG: response regulator transcription factor [Rikenellaceae bacterium]|nr:response regulator transcription factor [Rikenellaceae bacterium]
MSYRILLVDDEPDIIEFIQYNLVKEGYTVETAANGAEAVEKAAAFRPQLVLLDVMMPGMDGYEACRRIRSDARTAGTLIAFLTARGEDDSQIEGFDAGGDDYIPKPIKIKVLMSRIRALLKRGENSKAPAHDDGRAVKIDRERHLVILDGAELAIPRKEFNLLELLLSRPGKVFTREEIFSAVWGDDVVVGERTIDVHVRKLREKIGENHISTVKGVGYKYED